MTTANYAPAPATPFDAVDPVAPWEGAPAIHISDVQMFKQCRRRWHWASGLPGNRNLEPARTYTPFYLGRAVHHVLETLYRDGIDPKLSLAEFMRPTARKMRPMWDEEKTWLLDQYRQALGMCQHYILWSKKYRGPFCDRDLEFVAHEREFRLAMYNPARGTFHPEIASAGRFDGLVRYKLDGTLWLWEIKTCRSLHERIRLLANEEQTTSYIVHAERLLGEPIAGVIYTLLRKKLPTSPKLTASSIPGYATALSRNKSIDTTADWYYECIRRHHGVDAPRLATTYYHDILMHLMSEQEYFARIAVRRSEHEKALFAQELWDVAQEMLNPAVRLYPTPSYGCGFCPFQDPCLAYNAGESFDAMMETQFKQRTGEDVADAEDGGVGAHKQITPL